MSFKPIDGAKEDFRKYLDRKGVMDALTKAFVLCYDERPENPIERLVEVVADNAKVLGASSELKSRLINTELELKQARAEIDVLRKQLSDLGVTPGTTTTNVPTATGNGPTIATLSAEAEKSVPSSNTSAVEAAAVATGAIPKTPKATQGSPAKKDTPESNTESSETPVADATVSPPSTNDAKTQEETAATTTTTATNTEDTASSGTKEAAT
ncbi:c-Myc-binding protein homolog [Culicoides brevitarsis]|uniref:c-Myc-binding protein homolog n=1 Tax=Culicoides brevitarsis TaxID=469753 RepID=UPI00307CBB55